MQTIYGMISNNDDGSATMWWFHTMPDADLMEEKCPEMWACSEGISQVLTFPDNLDLELCGFRFNTMEDAIGDINND